MYVCICKKISESDFKKNIHSFIEDGRIKIDFKCGTCQPILEKIIEDNINGEKND